MNWWIWAVIGFVLLVLEVATPGGCVLLFFGAGALTVALLDALGIVNALPGQVFFFAVASVVSLILFRKRLLHWLEPEEGTRNVDNIVGELATADHALDVGALGKVQLRGSLWTAKNVGDRIILPHGACRVTKVEGLTLWVTPES